MIPLIDINIVILEVLIVCSARIVSGGCYPSDGCTESSGMVPLRYSNDSGLNDNITLFCRHAGPCWKS